MTAILLAPLLFLNLIAGFKTNGLPTSYPRVSTRLARVSSLVSSSSLSSASSALVPLEEALQRLDLQYQNNNPGGGLSGWRTLSDGETYVYVPESVPGCVVTFVGGAVLGKFPHISYNAFLKSLAEEACAIVIAPSYDLGVDHDKIAQDCERMLREGLREIKEDNLVSSNVPSFSLGHSLGSKIQTILSINKGGEGSAGLGLISFNNDDLDKSGEIMKQFIRGISGVGGVGGDDSTFGAFNDLVETVVDAVGGNVGTAFKPSRKEMNERIGGSDGIDSNICLFAFDDDDIDNSLEFVKEFSRRGKKEKIGVQDLKGNHLTPVYLDLEGALGDLGMGNFGMGSRLGFEKDGFAIGNLKQVQALTAAVKNWLCGGAPVDSDIQGDENFLLSGK